MKKKLKRWWLDSWINFVTHNCKNHQTKINPEENCGFESFCKKCGIPN